MSALREKSVTNSLFALFVIASLVTPSWRYGPFSWWPLGGAEVQLAGGPVKIGALNLLPILIMLAWVVYMRRDGARQWQWGARSLTIPLFLYTLWSSVRLWDAPPRYLFIYGGGLIIVWFVYLFVVNQAPPLSQILVIVLLLQTVIGVLQFLGQRDLGLIMFGELPLNPRFSGVTVIEARGQHWLRAYGLTAHPNLYGALLAACIILILLNSGDRSKPSVYRQPGLAAVGVVGLYFSFSRAAWLGLATGLTSWLFIRWRQGWRPPRRYRRWLVLLLVLLSGMLIVYGDIAFNRFTNLQNPLEEQSINQRLADADTALQLLIKNPWFGVGYGRYVDAAAGIRVGAARVHNVFLLSAAELGLPGLLTVTFLLAGPLWAFRQLYQRGLLHHVASGIAPWLLLLVVNQLDTTLWISGSWQTAILFALVAGHVSQRLTAPMNRPPRPLASAAEDRSAK